MTPENCDHMSLHVSKDGMISCRDCGHVTKESSRWKCLKCGEECSAVMEPSGGKPSRILCGSCLHISPINREKTCPHCAGTDTKLLSYTSLRNEISEAYHCNGCFKSFTLLIPMEREELTPPPRSPTTHIHGCGNGIDYTNGNYYGQLTQGVTSSYGGFESIKKVEGRCPVCRHEVTAYSKRGAYCQNCKEFVFVHILNPVKFLYCGEA